MSISDETREEVRRRANFTCEYCNVSENDVGGELTIDHFQPQSANGSDDFENLIYACHRCNLYKGDYWTVGEDSSRLWNPRKESFTEHFWLSSNGQIYAITEKAALTIKRLRLNRIPLINNRQRKIAQISEAEFIERLHNAAKLLEQTNQEQANLLEEQRKLLSEQQYLLNILLNIEK